MPSRKVEDDTLHLCTYIYNNYYIQSWEVLAVYFTHYTCVINPEVEVEFSKLDG